MVPVVEYMIYLPVLNQESLRQSLDIVSDYVCVCSGTYTLSLRSLEGWTLRKGYTGNRVLAIS